MAQTPPLTTRFESPDAARERLALLGLDETTLPIAATSGEDLVTASRALLSSGRVNDAVCVLAQALDRQACVWWACLAARREPAANGGTPQDEKEMRALAAAEAWVRRPAAASADAARIAATAAGLGTPAGCAALAAFLAGESLAPPGGTAVPPPEHLAGLAAAGAVRLAAVRRQPEIADQTLVQFLEAGLRIAAGRDSWEPSDTPPPPAR